MTHDKTEEIDLNLLQRATTDPEMDFLLWTDEPSSMGHHGFEDRDHYESKDGYRLVPEEVAYQAPALLRLAREQRDKLARLKAEVEEAHTEGLRMGANFVISENPELATTPELASLRKENARYKAILDEGPECLPGCDSFAHEELCPYVNPKEAFDALRKELEEAREVLRLVQWGGDAEWCEACKQHEDRGHESGCRLAALLSRPAPADGEQERVRIEDVHGCIGNPCSICEQIKARADGEPKEGGA